MQHDAIDSQSRNPKIVVKFIDLNYLIIMDINFLPLINLNNDYLLEYQVY